jgi:glucose/arabinose dehydrogenase
MRLLLLLTLAFVLVPFAAAHETDCVPNAPGQVEICTPTSGSVVNSPVRIIGAAAPTSGATIRYVQVYIDGIKRHEVVEHDDVDTSIALASGAHRLTLQAKDSSGVLFKQTLFFNVAADSGACPAGATHPSVTICTPSNGASVTSPMTVQAVASSSSPVKFMQIYLDGARVFHGAGSTLDTSVSTSAGTHRLTVQAQDVAGAIFKKTISVNVTNGAAAVPFKIVNYKTGLNFPVSMAFLPDGRLLYNELSTGNIRVIENGVLRPEPWASLAIVNEGEQGLIGLAVDSQYSSNPYVYVFYSAPSGFNRVVRFRDSGGFAIDQQLIIDGLPMALWHNSGNLVSGKDGRLYISIGDNTVPANSQDLGSKAGKILRYNRDGSIPADNPFGSGNPIYALGLRNSFDLTVHPDTGTIYASENGPECDDELNRIVPGGNYGWRPAYPCGDASSTYRQPIRRFNPVISPTGLMFYTGSVFPQFTGSLILVNYKVGKIRRYSVDESNGGRVISSDIIFDGGLGSLLDVVQGPEGHIYFTTTNGIYRIVPQ